MKLQYDIVYQQDTHNCDLCVKMTLLLALRGKSWSGAWVKQYLVYSGEQAQKPRGITKTIEQMGGVEPDMWLFIPHKGLNYIVAI